MTELIGTHEIPCLSDTDYAAYALYMKCLAEQVEAQLVANQAAADSALHRAIRVWTYSDSFAQGSAGAGGSASGILFSQNFPAEFADTRLGTLNLRGWWRFGMLLRAISNTPVLNNNRVANLAIYPPNTPSSLQTFEDGGAWTLRLEDITWESNTGNGETLFTSGEVYNPGDPDRGPNGLGMPMRQSIAIENTGSETVTITGNYWAIYLGDTPSIDI